MNEGIEGDSTTLSNGMISHPGRTSPSLLTVVLFYYLPYSINIPSCLFIFVPFSFPMNTTELNDFGFKKIMNAFFFGHKVIK